MSDHVDAFAEGFVAGKEIRKDELREDIQEGLDRGVLSNEQMDALLKATGHPEGVGPYREPGEVEPDVEEDPYGLKQANADLQKSLAGLEEAAKKRRIALILAGLAIFLAFLSQLLNLGVRMGWWS